MLCSRSRGLIRCAVGRAHRDQRRPRWRAFAAGLAALVAWWAAGDAASQVTLVETDDEAWVNDSIGFLLNGTSSANGKPHFPIVGDPAQSFGPGEAPDLSAAAAVLGGWLDPVAPDFSAPGWSRAVMPTVSWTVDAEIALAYEFDAQAITGLTAEVGVDNGVYIWLDGQFVGGQMRPGGVSPGEHVFPLGDVGAGRHVVQFVLEDHGTTNGFDLKITADAFVTTPGDFNGSGLVEQGDLNLVLSNWGEDTDASGVPPGWINTEGLAGLVEQAELNLVLQNWGDTQTPARTAFVVPEPLACLVLAGLLLPTRRSRPA